MPKLTDATYKSEITETGYVVGYQDGTFCRWLASLFEGSKWYAGTGEPNVGTGDNDDFYLNTSNGDVYQKASGAWGSAILNIVGTDGTSGVGVPTGGTSGQVLGKASATDYDTEWITPSPGGAEVHQTTASLAVNGSVQVTGKTVLAVYQAVNPTSTLVPTMTSNTTPSGVASADNAANGAAWYAFDTSTSTRWYTANTTLPHWIQYQFTVQTTVASYSVLNVDDILMRSWKFQGSNDGTNWTDLDVHTSDSSQSNGVTVTYNLAAPATYQYFRLYITASSNQQLAAIITLKLFGVPTYRQVIPYTDYTVSRVSSTGEQTLTITRLKSGSTETWVIDYL